VRDKYLFFGRMEPLSGDKKMKKLTEKDLRELAAKNDKRIIVMINPFSGQIYGMKAKEILAITDKCPAEMGRNFFDCTEEIYFMTEWARSLEVSNEENI
jgi:hypothetical protein